MLPGVGEWHRPCRRRAAAIDRPRRPCVGSGVQLVAVLAPDGRVGVQAEAHLVRDHHGGAGSRSDRVERGVVRQARSAGMGRWTNRLPTHTVKQSTIINADGGAPWMAAARSSGASIVGQPGRSSRCVSMRDRMSSSNGCAVATNTTDPSCLRPMATASELLPLRAPPTRKVVVPTSVVDAALGGDPGVVRVLHVAHLGDGVGDGDDRFGASRPVTITFTWVLGTVTTASNTTVPAGSVIRSDPGWWHSGRDG